MVSVEALGTAAIEWLETPDDTPKVDKPVKREGRDIRVSRVVECPHCQWLESELSSACFRCGGELRTDIRDDPTLRRLGISMDGVLVSVGATKELPLKVSPKLDAGAYLLRLEAERLRLIQGFDDLLSLEVVEVDQYEYQLEACRRALAHMRGRALLADEVGLGKTIEAGLVMKELLVRRMVSQVLVLTPASLVYQWREELETKFKEQFLVVTTAAQWDDVPDEGARVILSIDRAKGDFHSAQILDRPWDLLIIDEAHRLKNRSTRAYKFVKQIERRYMLMLTATPVHNDLTELYSLIDLLKPGQLGTLRSFKERFVKSGDPRSPENAPALKQLLGAVMIRNRRTEVDIRFPQRRAAVLHLELPQLERALYDDLSQFIRSTLRSEAESEKQRHLTLGLMTLQREVCSSPAAILETLNKMKADPEYSPALRQKFDDLAVQADAIGYSAKVDSVLEVLEHHPGKFLVFTEFKATLLDLLKALEESGISAVGFHGGLSGPEKERVVKAFKDDVRVMVSTESGGEGRNLQFCHQVINYDLPWNPMRVEQRIGRVHRLGQLNDVLVFNFSTKDTLEAYLLDLLIRKIRMFELVVGELDLILGESDKPGEVAGSFYDMVKNAWSSAEDEFDLQISMDEIGERFSKSRARYLDTRLLNEEVFNVLESYEDLS
ncbi:MAG: helicase SNF2 [Deltaproteobacteria bacterium CG_4_9_14_3_um_filter_63_12]|nr:MAG: helicase SNF2 [Deltaproteobacteria bacterium CG_4_9_14_3_um_filter_63_12]